VATIRALEFDDLPSVAALLRANLPGWSRDESFLAASLLDHRWADCDPPSLVAVADGQVVGFMGAQARRVVAGKEELLGVCASQLAVDPEHRSGASGALLLRKLLAGPQDLTWVDSATDLVARMWRTFGGTVDTAREVDWMLVLRPGRWSADIASGLARERRIRRRLAPVAAVPFHAAGPRIALRAFPGSSAALTAVEATPAEIVDAIPKIGRGVRLRVAHDTAYLEHQFARIGVAAGTVVSRLLHDGDRPVGWYVYLPRRGMASRVLHLEAVDSHLDAVTAKLADDARERGSSVLAGRLEPHLAHALRDRVAALGFGLQPLVHTRSPGLAARVASAASLLTELDSVDSTWWYRTGPSDGWARPQTR
jgi:GNAT superfamily N-acetyltransferase